MFISAKLYWFLMNLILVYIYMFVYALLTAIVCTCFMKSICKVIAGSKKGIEKKNDWI